MLYMHMYSVAHAILVHGSGGNLTRVFPRWAFLLSFLFILFPGPLALAQFQPCETTLRSAEQQQWDDTSPFITIIAPPEVAAGFQAAAGSWNSTCDTGGGNRNAPPFAVRTGTSRNAGENAGNSILVVLENAPRQSADGNVELGSWDTHDQIVQGDNRNIIAIPTNTGGTNPRNLDLGSPEMIPYYTHELGHSLGLGHDRNSPNCGSSIMSLPVGASINAGHCETIKKVQLPLCSSGSNFKAAIDAISRGSACPPGCECPSADTPDPLDGVLGFCDRFPESCGGGDDPWWDDDPFETDWGVSCAVVSWSDSTGNSGYSVDCQVIYYYLTAGKAGSQSADPNQFSGDGPFIKVDSVPEGSTVTGRIEIKGSAVSPSGVGDVALWLDDHPITLDEWKTAQPWGNCSHPTGGSDPDCPNVGFSGFLDTSHLALGTHVLKVVAADRRNPYPRPGLLTLTFKVGTATCTDGVPPTITLVAPAAGSTVSGTTTISTSPADNIGVAKVQYFFDGAMIGEKRAAPWDIRWDTRRVANGGHYLRVRAIDACENFTWSPTILLTVNNVENPPVARNDAAATHVGIATVIRVLDNDSDADGDAIQLDANPILSAPNHGTATRESNSTIRYTPVASYSGNDRFRYRVVDTTGRSDTAWVVVAVEGVNHQPVANNDTASGQTNRPLQIDVLANDTDADNDILSLIATPITSPPLHGRADRISRTSVSYTPGNGFTGTDRFQYEIGDGHGRRARAWVTVTIADTNHPPVAVNDSASTTGTNPITINVTANDSDPDGDLPMLISSPIVTAPAHGTASKVSGSEIVYTPAANFIGTDSFVYEIGDGNGKRARATVTVTVVDANQNPVASDDAATTTPGTLITINVTANDSDPDGDPVTLIASPIVTAPAHGTATKISASSITYKPATGYGGTDTFRYEIADGRGKRSQANVVVTISSTGGGNRNPVAVNDSVSIHRDNSIDVNVTANDSDPDNDPVTLITAPVIVAPAHGTATKLSGSTIRYTPATGFAGSDTFQYEVGDGRGLRSRAWVSISVTDTNNRPVAVSDTARVAPGNVISINVTANDSDPDHDTVSLISNCISFPPTHGTATKLSATNIQYTPAAGWTGVDHFQYEIGDGHGARARAWVDVTTTYAAAWAAFEIDNAPPLAQNDRVVSATSETPLNILTNDDDPDHDYLALSSAAIVTQPQFGSVRRISDTVIGYTPGSGFTGNDAFEYETVDPNGTTSRAWVAVRVPAVNEAPIARADAYTVPSSREALFDPTKNDSDTDLDEVVLTEGALVSQPGHGLVRRVSAHVLGYTPDAGYIGTDAFQYEVTDTNGAQAQATITLNVTNQNIGPVAVNDSFTTDAGVAVALPLLANDSDANGDALRVVSSLQPAHGSVTWDPDPTAPGVYTPAPGWYGIDTFTYTISDAAGLESTATVTITVQQIRREPVVGADSADTRTLTAVIVGVLANDYDPDGNRLTIKSVSVPAHGTVTGNASESVTYTPANGFSGTDTFTYVAADGTGMESTGTVTIHVLNDAPIPHSDSIGAIEDTFIGYSAWQFLSNDYDADGQTLSIIAVTQPANGQLLVSSDFSQFSYKPKQDWFGIDGFYYTVSDGFGGTAQGYVQLNVSSVNDPPVANDDSFSVYKNQLLTIAPAQVLTNDTDVEKQQLSVYLVDAPTNGTATKQADGSITYQPYGEFVGADSFTYRVQDSGGAVSMPGRINVNVLQDTKPVANFTVTCTGRSCYFDASSSTDDRGIVTYAWTLGNNNAAGGKTFTYVYPNAGFYQVRLTVSDTLGQTSAVLKYANAVEPPPDARDDSYSWRKGYARYVDYASMLSNDTDPNNDQLTVQSTDATLTDGTLTCDSTGCLFTPPSSYWYGVTTFKYTVSDGHGATDTATVTINFTY
jgi:large repetitive protein